MRGTIIGGLTLFGMVSYLSYSSAQKKPAEPPENVRLIASIQGPALYQAYCAVCHGLDGKGGGPMARSLKVRPPDLTHLAPRYGGTFPMERIEKVISGEEPVASGHGTREMPIWGPIFSQIAWDQDLGRVRVDNLARYLRDIQAK